VRVQENGGKRMSNPAGLVRRRGSLDRPGFFPISKVSIIYDYRYLGDVGNRWLSTGGRGRLWWFGRLSRNEGN